MILVTLSGLSRMPSVQTWNSTTIRPSATIIPYCRRLLRIMSRKRSPMPRVGVGCGGTGAAPAGLVSVVVMGSVPALHHVAHEGLLGRVSAGHLARQPAFVQRV